MNMWLALLNLLTLGEYSFTGDNDNFCKQTFPKDFMFGVGTSAFQIEGAWNEDGKGESNFDRFTHTNPDRGNIDVACDSYHKYKEDIAMLRFLGVTHYKMTISWPRVLPTGLTNNTNEKGVQYYKNFIRELKSYNIEPVISLFHFEMPQVLQELGGILNDSFIDWYADYSRFLFEVFGEDVKHWITFNEGFIICFLGYVNTILPPAVPGRGIDEYKCGHNILKAHAKVWHMYDDEFRPKQKGNISMAFAVDWPFPESESPEHVAAARLAREFALGWFADPIYHGDYPIIMKNRIAYRSYLEGFQQSRLPKFTEEEKNYIRGTIDYFCLQTYEVMKVKNLGEPSYDSPPSLAKDMLTDLTPMGNSTLGGLLLVDLLEYVNENYNYPTIIVTENGFPSTKPILEDDDRIYYLKCYLNSIKKAIDSGIKIIGYFVWSLLDNYNADPDSGGESRMRYGLYQVDFSSPNRTRTPRKSAYFYKHFINYQCL